MNPTDIVSNPSSTTTTSATSSATAASPSPDGFATRFSEAFARRKDAIAAVPNDALIQVNLDVPTLVTTMLASIPRIVSYRGAMQALLSDFDPAVVDRLEDDVLALGEAHMAWTTAATAGESLPELTAEAMRRRDSLYVHAQALAEGGLISQTTIDEVKANGGYRGVAFELLGICRLLREGWPTFVGKTSVTPADIADGQAIGDRLVRAITERQASPKVVAAAALTRQRAFKCFADDYDQIRRAMGALRWREGDADTIAPSMYPGRPSGSRRSAKSDAAAPAATSATTGTAPAQPLDTPATADPGLPGASPYAA